MIGAHRKRAPHGRKKNSGQAALATHGDGWGKLARYPDHGARGPFDTSPRDAADYGHVPNAKRCAAFAIVQVQRKAR